MSHPQRESLLSGRTGGREKFQMVDCSSESRPTQPRRRNGVKRQSKESLLCHLQRALGEGVNELDAVLGR